MPRYLISRCNKGSPPTRRIQGQRLFPQKILAVAETTGNPGSGPERAKGQGNWIIALLDETDSLVSSQQL